MWARRLWFGDAGRLRIIWRLLAFIVVAVLAVQVAGLVLYPPLQTVGHWLGWRLIIYGWVAVIGLLFAHHVSLRRIDHLPWSAAGLGRAAARPALLVWGFLVGALAIGIPSLLLLVAGLLRVEPQPDGSALTESIRAFILLAPLAFTEELIIRGYPLMVLREAWGARAAIGITSVVFGLLHIGNPGSTPAAIVMAMLAGVMLGAMVVATGSLYAAAAAHLAWNWTMAAILHVPVSGFPVATPDYRLVDAGPDWATGGQWGPEAGIAAALGMGGVLMYLHVRRVRRREV